MPVARDTTLKKGSTTVAKSKPKQTTTIKTTTPSPPIDFRKEVEFFPVSRGGQLIGYKAYNYPTGAYPEFRGLVRPSNEPPGGAGGAGGGGAEYGTGGGSTGASQITWRDAYSVEGAPSWWRGRVPSEAREDVMLAALVNAMIPHLSPEDQRQMAEFLYTAFPDAFADYAPDKIQFAQPITEPKPEDIQRLASKKRGQDILGTLERVASAMGKSEKDLGAGYRYLKSAASVVKDFGIMPGYQGLTRQQKLKLASAIDPLLAQGKAQELSPYQEVARAVVKPFITGEDLMKMTQTGYDTSLFGQRNKRFFV